MIYNKLGCGSVEKIYKNVLIRELKIGKIRGFLKQALYLCPSVVKKRSVLMFLSQKFFVI
jgi:hypothetical protein